MQIVVAILKMRLINLYIQQIHHIIINIGTKAARLMSKLIICTQDRIKKDQNDFASQIDKAAEEIIIEQPS